MLILVYILLQFNLNTYHVKVQYHYTFLLILKVPHLNTYHVKVQLEKEEINKEEVVFKYIPC